MCDRKPIEQQFQFALILNAISLKFPLLQLKKHFTLSDQNASHNDVLYNVSPPIPVLFPYSYLNDQGTTKFMSSSSSSSRVELFLSH